MRIADGETVTIVLPVKAAIALAYKLDHEWDRTKSLDFLDYALWEALGEVLVHYREQAE